MSLELIPFDIINVYLISRISLAEVSRHCFPTHLSLGVKGHISLRCFPYIKAPPKILCLDRSYRPRLDQTELTFFTLQFKLICAEPSAQSTWYPMQIFLMQELLKNILNFLRFTFASNCFWRILGRLLVCLSVCLTHNLLLGTEYSSSVVADDRCHPAVLLCQQWLNVAPRAKFLVSVLKKRKCKFTAAF